MARNNHFLYMSNSYMIVGSNTVHPNNNDFNQAHLHFVI
jgi:hypothetical protein